MSKQIDFDRAFPKTPEAIHRAVELGFRRGRRAAKLRHRRIALMSVAAGLILIIGVAILSSSFFAAPRNHRPTDVLSQPSLSPSAEAPATPSPSPDSSAAPASNLSFKTLALNDLVYCGSDVSVEGLSYFHLTPSCEGISSEHSATLPLMGAISLYRLPCPLCVRPDALSQEADICRLMQWQTVYATAYGHAYHSDIVCSGMYNDSALSTLDALLLGKEPCLTCAPRQEFMMTLSGEPLDPEQPVYFSAENCYYHTSKDCAAVREQPSTEGAFNCIMAGLFPCPLCTLPQYTSELKCKDDIRGSVYTSADESDACFHLMAECENAVNPSSTDLSAAIEMGKMACPDCFTTVFATEGGVYYHTQSDCMSMLCASPMLIPQALEMGKQPCPICVLHTESESFAVDCDDLSQNVQ